MTSTAAASTRQSSSPPTASYVAATSIARNRSPPPNTLYRMASATRGSTPPNSRAQLRNALLEQRERGVQLGLLLLEAGRDGLETLQARLEAHGSLPDAETA